MSLWPFKPSRRAYRCTMRHMCTGADYTKVLFLIPGEHEAAADHALRRMIRAHTGGPMPTMVRMISIEQLSRAEEDAVREHVRSLAFPEG